MLLIEAKPYRSIWGCKHSIHLSLYQLSAFFQRLGWHVLRRKYTKKLSFDSLLFYEAPLRPIPASLHGISCRNVKWKVSWLPSVNLVDIWLRHTSRMALLSRRTPTWCVLLHRRTITKRIRWGLMQYSTSLQQITMRVCPQRRFCWVIIKVHLSWYMGGENCYWPSFNVARRHQRNYKLGFETPKRPNSTKERKYDVENDGCRGAHDNSNIQLRTSLSMKQETNNPSSPRSSPTAMLI